LPEIDYDDNVAAARPTPGGGEQAFGVGCLNDA
jgi:hypothetical protein